MTRSLEWNFGSQNRVESNVVVSLNDEGNQLKSISFRCIRLVPHIDPSISSIFKHATKGKADQDMQPNSKGCLLIEDYGHCGNLRGDLSECRCEVLDRKKHRDRRLYYEDQVITTIFDILQCRNQSSFHLKLAIFCSGGLLGEEILLFRLLNHLKAKNKNMSGTIELFFIDTCYKNAINNSKQTGNFEDSIGNDKSIEQFLKDICKCLPQDINVQGTFFDSADSYIEEAKANKDFEHDLLIGADIQGADEFVEKISRSARLGSEQPIILLKKNTSSDPNPQANLCTLDSLGKLANCYTIPTNIRSEILVARRNNDNKDLIILTVGFTVIAVALVAIIVASLELRRNLR